MNVIAQAALVVSSLGTIGGGALYLNNAHVASEDFSKHLAEQRVNTIFNYTDQIEANGPQSWLCNALEEELYNLCTALPNHAMCKGDTMDDIIEEAGC